jgi:hypothetical protein
LAATAIIGFGPGLAAGHGLLLASVTVTEEAATGQVQVSWRSPPDLAPDALRYELLGPCSKVAEPTVLLEGGGTTMRQSWHCPGGLGKVQLVARGRASLAAQGAVRVRHASGRSETMLLDPTSPGLSFGGASTKLSPWWGYGWLGCRHILSGADHLLFVTGLMLLVLQGAGPRPWRSLLAAITGFTLGHSVTLSLAALTDLAPPQAPTEAAIALSILYLACELAAGQPAGREFPEGSRPLPGPQPSRRHGRPWVLAATFGLLHGFGFAGALAATGLPQGQRMAGLLAFNLGVEAGQLAFVACLWPMLWLGLRRLPAGATLARRLPVLAMGIASGYWLVARSAWLWS